ncbi:trans-aconitate 2-methyltransferase, partial [Asticcacaulis sp. AC402]|uniref:class I SAM-dependent methyltransferase n=1 Tax=Asticcacaulis sp. AC402 TaxID=1282361 RepID=UPI0004CE2B9C
PTKAWENRPCQGATVWYMSAMHDLTALQQTQTTTFSGRNVELMKDVRKYLDEAGKLSGAKVLSFGCSTGEECLDLAEVMPDGRIYGTDINEKALIKARAQCPEDITIFMSAESSLAKHGPFDAIFAMSVFCKWPKTSDMTDISEVYPFSLFEEGISTLDRHLKPGGVLCLYNSQYMLDDTALAELYQPLDRSQPLSSGWMFRCSPDGRVATRCHFEFEGTIYTAQQWADNAKANRGKPPRPGIVNVFQKWEDEARSGHQQPDAVIWRKAST